MVGNMTEQAVWQRQYYLNVNSSYGGGYGSGWYNANGTAAFGVARTVVGISNGTRMVFSGWSNGAKSNASRVAMPAPASVTAYWGTQYLVNATTPYGNVTGNGWYPQNSTAKISLSGDFVPKNGSSRLALQQWSNGRTGNSIQITVNAPVSLAAQFATQNLVTLFPRNSYGAPVPGVSYFNVSGSIVSNGTVYLFSNTKYNVEYVYYKGVMITLNYVFVPSAPGTVQVQLPVYDVVLSARGMFGEPVNASLSLTFRNGTNTSTHTGNSGALALHNVPYGYVAGNAAYFGVVESVNAANGANSNLTFITPSLVIVVLGGVALVIAVAVIAKRVESRRKTTNKSLPG